MDTKIFLDDLAAMLDGGYQIGIWSLPSKRGRWFADADQALSHTLQLDCSKEDVYIHVGVAPPDHTDDRATSAQLAGRLAFVADLDLSYDRAMAVIARCGVEPSMVVCSGHGYHAWWFFNEPVIYDGPEALYDREEVEAIAYDWHRTLQAHARDLGITEKIDGVFDLARILRVPGTKNLKHEVAAPVEIVHRSEARYGPHDFAAWLLPPEQLQLEPAAEPAAVGTLLLRADAAPPSDKFAVLIANYEDFGRTWRHERDEEFKDSSASGYDLALANIAASAGWTEQEIANLLIAHRRAQSADLKLRQDYYARTIGKALSHRDQEAVMAGQIPVTPDNREAGLAQLREMLDVPLQDIVFLDGSAPIYRFDFGPAGLVQMAAELVRSRQSWDRKVFATTRLPPRTPTGKGAEETWRQVCRAFGALATHVEVGEEASIDNETRAILEQYRQRWPAEHVKPGAVVSDDESPFYRDGRMWVRPDQIRHFARQIMDLRLERGELMQRLRLIGAENKTVHVRFPDGTTTTRSFWGIPLALFDGPEDPDAPAPADADEGAEGEDG